MTPITEPDICAFGAGVLEKHLAALRAELPGVRAGEDIEAIHRMRVASRRFRAALPLFAGCFSRRQQRIWEREIKRLTKALGDARDTDVQIDSLVQILAEVPENRLKPGVRRVVLRLSQQRARLQGAVARALNSLEKSGALLPPDCQAPIPQEGEQPGAHSHALYLLSSGAIGEKLTAFLAYEIYVPRPEAETELHAMRIAAKHLRYTMETFGPLYNDGLKTFISAIRSAQELLGGLHDCDVWAAFLPVFRERELERVQAFYGHSRPFLPLLPGLAYLEENRKTERARLYAEFVQHWDRWTHQNLWQQILDTLHLPLSMVPTSGAFDPLVFARPSLSDREILHPDETPQDNPAPEVSE